MQRAPTAEEAILVSARSDSVAMESTANVCSVANCSGASELQKVLPTLLSRASHVFDVTISSIN